MELKPQHRTKQKRPYRRPAEILPCPDQENAGDHYPFSFFLSHLRQTIFAGRGKIIVSTPMPPKIVGVDQALRPKLLPWRDRGESRLARIDWLGALIPESLFLFKRSFFARQHCAYFPQDASFISPQGFKRHPLFRSIHFSIQPFHMGSYRNQRFRGGYNLDNGFGRVSCFNPITGEGVFFNGYFIDLA